MLQFHGPICRACGQRGFEQPVFTPLQRQIVVIERAEQFLAAETQLGPHVTTQRGHAIRMCEQDGFAPLSKFEQQFVKQPAGAFVEREDTFEIKNEVFDAIRAINHVLHDGFGGGEGEIALKLIDLERRTELVQRLGFLERAHTAGVEFRAGEL